MPADSFDTDNWLEGGVTTDEPADALTADKAALAAITGLTPRAIDRLRRDGLPTLPLRKGAPLAFHVPAVVQWLLARDGDSMDGAKRRMTEATARKREVEAARLEGRFVDIETVESVIRDQVAKLQSELAAIPARLPVAVRALAAAEIQAAVNRLAFDGVNPDA